MNSWLRLLRPCPVPKSRSFESNPMHPQLSSIFVTFLSWVDSPNPWLCILRSLCNLLRGHLPFKTYVRGEQSQKAPVGCSLTISAVVNLSWLMWQALMCPPSPLSSWRRQFFRQSENDLCRRKECTIYSKLNSLGSRPHYLSTHVILAFVLSLASSLSSSCVLELRPRIDSPFLQVPVAHWLVPLLKSLENCQERLAWAVTKTSNGYILILSTLPGCAA